MSKKKEIVKGEFVLKNKQDEYFVSKLSVTKMITSKDIKDAFVFTDLVKAKKFSKLYKMDYENKK